MRRARIGFTAEPKLTRYVVRLWIDGTADQNHADAVLAMAVDLATQEISTQAAAEAIANAIEGLNAVEVLDGDQQGHLIYPEWP